jgi:hypothetical protein
VEDGGTRRSASRERGQQNGWRFAAHTAMQSMWKRARGWRASRPLWEESAVAPRRGEALRRGEEGRGEEGDAVADSMVCAQMLAR